MGDSLSSQGARAWPAAPGPGAEMGDAASSWPPEGPVLPAPRWQMLASVRVREEGSGVFSHPSLGRLVSQSQETQSATKWRDWA